MKIGVFDSGLGGITVLKSLMKKFPHNEYIYYADLKNMPYGQKSDTELIQIGKDILTNLSKFDIDVYVVACGTLSSVAFEQLKQIVDSENAGRRIFGIIEPLVNSLSKSKSSSCLLLATPATHKKGILRARLQDIATGINIYSEGCKEFVELVEGDNIDREYSEGIVRKYTEAYIGKVDTVICGCTHYILLEEYFKSILGDVLVLDPGIAITKEYGKYISGDKHLSSDTSLKILMTKYSEPFVTKTKKLLNIDDTPFICI